MMARKPGLDEGNLPEAAFFILLAVRNTRHGYSIMQHLQERSGGLVTIGPASLYTTLKKLADAELIEEVDSSNNRRSYRMTAKGMEVATKNGQRRPPASAGAGEIPYEGIRESNGLSLERGVYL